MQQNVSIPREQAIQRPFRPRARLLQLLGDQLIGSSRLAVFELVKNAYDADADLVSVTLSLGGASEKPSIIVQDNGEGMTLTTVENIWLIPGDDHREKQRIARQRTPKYHRLPLGEKGLGRFAVHKLGDTIRLITRAQGEYECVVEIDWRSLIAVQYLDNAPVTIRTREPAVFKGSQTGTRIEIGDLRQDGWTRGEVRRLFKQITSICSPFEAPGSFVAKLIVPQAEHWLEDLPDTIEIRNRAPWKFTFKVNADGGLEWSYSFRQIAGVKLDGRSIERKSEPLKLPPGISTDTLTKEKKEKKVIADQTTLAGIGPISGEFFVYDRDRDLLQKMSNVQLLTEYLDENGGMRVYRDGIRVYNYGEPNDDWLGLDLRRVNAPTRGISRNIILGVINLSQEDSFDLIEKTNREGFVENDASERLRRIILGVLATLEAERQIDKERIRQVVAAKGNADAGGITKPIAALRNAIAKNNLQPTVRTELEKCAKKIEDDYNAMQETFLTAGVSSVGLAVVFHEVERGVRALHQVITEGADPEAAARHAKNLMQLLDGFSILLRKDKQSTHTARKLVTAVRTFVSIRLQFHKVRLICPLLETMETGFESKFAFNLIVGALTNLIDNALYWLRVRWPHGEPGQRKLYIGISNDFEAGPAIIVADNGPGFQGDAPSLLVKPFFTRKPTGMGLGLYYANLAMELNGGQLVFPAVEDLELPEGLDGAAIALVFKESKK